jgi:hypothetical protein
MQLKPYTTLEQVQTGMVILNNALQKTQQFEQKDLPQNATPTQQQAYIRQAHRHQVAASAIGLGVAGRIPSALPGLSPQENQTLQTAAIETYKASAVAFNQLIDARTNLHGTQALPVPDRVDKQIKSVATNLAPSVQTAILMRHDPIAFLQSNLPPNS